MNVVHLRPAPGTIRVRCCGISTLRLDAHDYLTDDVRLVTCPAARATDRGRG